MGVVYKLTPNVIDFILEQKKKDFKLSCRRLVFVIQEQFKINVSKSAVNKIIQEASLSNPVGRTPKTLKINKKKFQIPKEKKEQLFGLEPQLLQDVKDFPKKEKIEESVDPVVLKKDFLNKDVPLFPAAGLFLLKAAQAELGPESCFGWYLKGCFQDSALGKFDAHVWAEAFFWKIVLGLNVKRELTQQEKEWLSFFVPESGTLNISDSQVIDNIKDVKNLIFKMNNDLPPVFSSVSQLRFLLNKSTLEELWVELDPVCRSVVVNDGPRDFCPSFRAIEEGVGQFVSHVHPIMLRKNWISSEFLQEEKDFLLGIMSNLGISMSKISFLNEKQQEIAEFSLNQFKEKFFIFETSLQQKELAYLSKEVLNFKPVNLFFSDQALLVAETTVYFSKDQSLAQDISLRALIIKENNENLNHKVLLINDLYKKSDDVIEIYFLMMPSNPKDFLSGDLRLDINNILLNESLNLVEENNSSAVNENLEKSAHFLLGVLKRYVFFRFFSGQTLFENEETMFKFLFNLTGKTYSHEKLILIKLQHIEINNVMDSYAPWLKQINSFNIQDLGGRVLRFDVDV